MEAQGNETRPAGIYFVSVGFFFFANLLNVAGWLRFLDAVGLAVGLSATRLGVGLWLAGLLVFLLSLWGSVALVEMRPAACWICSAVLVLWVIVLPLIVVWPESAPSDYVFIFLFLGMPALLCIIYLLRPGFREKCRRYRKSLEVAGTASGEGNGPPTGSD